MVKGNDFVKYISLPLLTSLINVNMFESEFREEIEPVKNFMIYSWHLWFNQNSILLTWNVSKKEINAIYFRKNMEYFDDAYLFQCQFEKRNLIQ